jgi:hypothetical protein
VKRVFRAPFIELMPFVKSIISVMIHKLSSDPMVFFVATTKLVP